MYFEGSITISRPCQEVWDFLGDISNISKWDRGVSRAEPIGESVPGVGFEFETFAHPRAASPTGEWGKMAYRITEIDPVRRSTAIELTSRTGNARYVQSAVWYFRSEEVPEGSCVFSAVDFKLHLRAYVSGAVADAFLATRDAQRPRKPKEGTRKWHKLSGRSKPCRPVCASGRRKRLGGAWPTSLRDCSSSMVTRTCV